MMLDQPTLVGNLPVGSYELVATPPGGPGVVGFTSFEMGTSDLEVTVKLPRAAKLTVHAVNEPAAGQQPAPQSGIRLQFLDAATHFDPAGLTPALSFTSTASFVASSNSMAASSSPSYSAGLARILSTPTGTDGVSSIPAITPGQFRVSLSGIPEGMYLASMKSGNRDVLRDGLDIASGDDQKLEVVLGESPGVVRGVISDRTGKKNPGAIVVLIPDDRSMRAMYLLTFSDKNGSFEFNASPGAYQLFAWTELDGAAYRNADFMRKYDDSGTPVRLSKGSRSTVDLKILDDVPARQ
jgi:hypothetical protein